MANQSEMLHRLRKLYTPMHRTILSLNNQAEACAEYWRQLTPAQQNAVALLNRDAAIWKAAWDLGGPFQTVQNAYEAGYANGQYAANAPAPRTAVQEAAAPSADLTAIMECIECDQ